jgi:hypothetical protein
MAYYADLADCTYCDPPRRDIAIGWLEAGHPYTKGPPPGAEMIDKLARLALVAKGGFMGWHDCSMCRLAVGPRTIDVMTASGSSVSIEMGIRNIFVPAKSGRLYVAPSLILHYIDSHEYAPPAEFMEAVRSCPAPEGEEYERALRRGGLV